MTEIEQKSIAMQLKLAREIIGHQNEIISAIVSKARVAFEQVGPLIKTEDESGITMSKAGYDTIANFYNAIIDKKWGDLYSWLHATRQSIETKTDILNAL